MKKQYFVEKTTLVNARPDNIFDVLLRFDVWKRWTRSITDMYILDDAPVTVGGRIKVVQPKLPPAIWTITGIERNKALTWEKSSTGLTMISEHIILTGATETRVTIRMTYAGTLARLFYTLTHNLTDRYMTMEIDGLKKECEKA